VSDTLPADIEAERNLLGAIIIENAVLDTVDSLVAVDFYRGLHREVFDAMRLIREEQGIIDVVTLRDNLLANGASNPGYLTEAIGSLIDGVPRVVNGAEWAAIIQRKAALRRLAQAGQDLARKALEPDADPDELAPEAQAAFASIGFAGSRRVWRDNLADAKAAMRDIEERSKTKDGILGLRTGLRDLDKLMLGMLGPQLGLVGGRLKSGKTILLLNLAANAVAQGAKAAMFSFEMSGVALAERRISSEAGVNPKSLYAIDDQVILEQRWARLAAAFGIITRDDMKICTDRNLNVKRMLNECVRLKMERGLDVVFIDYLQLIKPEHSRSKRNEEVAEIARDLSNMALTLGIPVIVATQLNRESEGRKNNRPIMADIADSDEPGRACTWAVLIHREPPPLAGEAPGSTRNLADLILAANRTGFSGVARVVLNRSIQQYQDYSRAEE